MSKFTLSYKVDFSKLDKMEESIKEVIGAEIEAFGYEVVNDAKRNTPVDLGGLRNSISHDYLNSRTTITVAANYAAYVEFGTGTFAATYVPSLPPAIQAYAMTFFKTGKGRLPAKPFLFPAYFKNLPLLKERLAAYKLL